MINAARLLKVLGSGILGLLLLLQSPQQLQRQLDQNAGRLEAVDERTKALEAVHIEAQLARIETTVEDDHRMIYGTAIVVFLSSLETIASYVRKRRKYDQTDAD